MAMISTDEEIASLVLLFPMYFSERHAASRGFLQESLFYHYLKTEQHLLFFHQLFELNIV
jgi:hypothetical protein